MAGLVPAIHVLLWGCDAFAWMRGTSPRMTRPMMHFHSKGACSSVLSGAGGVWKMSILHQYFGFSGRINRGRFWLLSILLIVFSILAWVVAFLVALFILGVNVTDGSGLDQPDKLVQMILDYAVAFIVLLGVAIAIWVSWFAIGVKRLHDRDKSGWWIVVFYILPWILGGAANTVDKQGNDTLTLILSLIGLLLMLWGIVVLGFLRGTRGPNRFGPDPLQG
jgi:uncharacterized membrane protein YhaH (DUF805 family)